jgi:hypothetical protein
MKIGFSFSPGGLLFPYHIGVLSSLSKNGYINNETPIAGSSAGAIAVASHAVGIDTEESLNACIRMSESCINNYNGNARGQLLNLLQDELEGMLPCNSHEIINDREGFTGLAYRELFPYNRPILHNKFNTREELIEAICNSSMFPFFTSNLPFLIRKGKGSRILIDERQQQQLEQDNNNNNNNNNNNIDNEQQSLIVKMDNGEEYSTNSLDSFTSTSNRNSFIRNNVRKYGTDFMSNLPRLVVDGFFTVDRNRFGCPIFPNDVNVDRTITVSCFPHELIGLNVSNKHDRISPKTPDNIEDIPKVLEKLLRSATKPSTAKEHIEQFENGYKDAKLWIQQEEENKRLQEEEQEEDEAVDSFFISNLQQYN